MDGRKGIAALLVLLLLLCGCQGAGAGKGENGTTGGGEQLPAEEQNIGIYDVTTGDASWKEMKDTFPSMLWGRYTYDEWTAAGAEEPSSEDAGNTAADSGEAAGSTADSSQPVKYRLDYKKFYDNAKFLKCSVTLEGKTVSKELSAVPIEITAAFPLGASKNILEALQLKEFNPYQTNWGDYYWERPINNTWGLQEWEDKIHELYLKRFRNEHWNNFKKLMNQNVIQMEFMTKEKKVAIASFLYQVEGNQLHLYEWEADPDTFEISMTKWCTMEFCFSGRNLMLRREGCTVAYCPTIFSKGAQSTAHGVIYTDGFANDVNDTCGELLGFFWHSGEEGKGTISFTDGGKAVEKLVRANAEELTFQWTKRYRRKDDQLVLEELAGEMSVGYVWTEPFGVLLVKDGKYYRYQNSENHYYEEQVGQFLGDDVAVEDLSQSQVNKLIAEREAILTELQKAFEEAQIHVEVDPNGGKVTMDSSILFGVDQDSLSEEGKEYLDRFLKVYSAVVLGERFVDTVSEVLVEGHTDTDGSYEHNLDLSERRASHVMQYCLEICPELEGRISAKGCSFDNPIYDAEGAVDKDASRRVVFKFKLRVAEENIE